MSDPIEVKDSIAVDSIKTIEKDVVQLKECMDMLHKEVQAQQDEFDTIEDIIQQTQHEIQWSQKDIEVAENYAWNYRYLVTPILFGVITALTGVVYGIF
jgi:t-SNARE complex subunit (syntaxin)